MRGNKRAQTDNNARARHSYETFAEYRHNLKNEGFLYFMKRQPRDANDKS